MLKITAIGNLTNDIELKKADYFGTEAMCSGGSYDSWAVLDTEGKTWKIMSDSSIRGEQKVGNRYLPTVDRVYQVEMVSPKRCGNQCYGKHGGSLLMRQKI